MEKKKSYGFENDLNLKLVIALNRSTNHLRQHEIEAIAQAGLTISQFGVLEMLYHKGPLRISQIIEKSLFTSGNLTVVINNLEKMGFVNRIKDPQDKRAMVIGISATGSKLIERIFPDHLANIQKGLANLTNQEKKSLIELLKILTEIKTK